MDVSPILESVALLKECKIPYEFRTTVVKGIHSVGEIEEIGKLLAGSRAYYLQGFRESDGLLGGNFSGYTMDVYVEGRSIGEAEAAEEDTVRVATQQRWKMTAFDREDMEKMAAIARKYIDKVELRGVE